MTEPIKHPAKFSEPLMEIFKNIIDERLALTEFADILDPFAGVGRIHRFHGYRDRVKTRGIEIQPKWAKQHERTKIGDATELPFQDGKFDLVITSPTYGNRMADHHNARDDSKRYTYRSFYGEPLEENNSGKMQWGPAYRALHAKAWQEVHRVLCGYSYHSSVHRPGWFVLNIKDHDRSGKRQFVPEWHIAALVRIGFTLIRWENVLTPHMGHGENREVRYPEQVYVFQKTNSKKRD